MDQQPSGETPIVSLSGNSSEVLVVEARDRGFQVHVLVNVEHIRHGNVKFTILNGMKHQEQFQNNCLMLVDAGCIVF